MKDQSTAGAKQHHCRKVRFWGLTRRRCHRI